MPWEEDGSRKTSTLYKKSGFRMKGWGGYQNSPMKQKQEHEGKQTISGDHLSKLVTAGKVIDKPSTVTGSVDYYYTMQDGKHKIHGEVGLEKGKVTGVPGTKGGELTRQ